MHLLRAEAGAIQNEGEAIDLGQSPAPVLFLSSADSELSLLAGAADRAGFDGLRLANLLRLTHNLSVDEWIERTARHAKLIVVRLLGGAAYWPYGVDHLEALARNGGPMLVLLPGEAQPDPALVARSTLSPDMQARLHGLFTAGGPDNADTLLTAFRDLAEGRTPAIEPRPFPRFGYWLPETGIVPDLSASPGPNVPLLFYRAALEGAGTATLEALIAALRSAGLNPVPLLVSTLKEAACIRFVKAAFAAHPPEVVLNLTGFALGLDGLDPALNPFAEIDAPVIQLVQGSRSRAQWLADSQGLSSKDLAMQVVLPELDGRHGMLLVGHKEEARWHARTEAPLSAYSPDPDGIARAVTLAGSWVRLRRAAPETRKLALVLANYPVRDGRLANGVGYDAPQSTVEILRLMREAGYAVGDAPGSSAALMDRLLAGPTNADPSRGTGIPFALADYQRRFETLPDPIRAAVTARWGGPEADPFVRGDSFHLPGFLAGNVAVLLQPARGYHLDPATTWHDPDLVPPHGYLAAYLWVRHGFAAHAIIHNGKHGTLEWLPGKATALDAQSYPLTLWDGLPQLYPFIVNDPGEGTQAKRRTGAVIIDHLVPPLTRAETYGPLKDLEALLEEYYAASGMDRRRLKDLERRILDFARDARLDRDVPLSDDPRDSLVRLDTFLCDLKEAQIRDGLHIFGQSPTGRLERDTLVALARVPRGESPGEASLIRALADDLKLGLDPLTADLGARWRGPGGFRRIGDVVSYLEAVAAELVEGRLPEPDWTATRAVLETLEHTVRPRLRASGPNEQRALLDGLAGRFIAPGPSGAPSRGRLDVLPTGRNFYSVDNRAVPTSTAWELGRKSAEALLTRYFQDHGTPLRALALSVWGTSNMRTGGDDIAQALALIGAKPVWDPGSLRVSGYEIIPLAKLGRPRVDVTLRISGFFRDAFPAQIALMDRAIRAIGALDEPADQNPIADRMRIEALGLMKDGSTEREAARVAGQRIFGSKPGAYGAGLQALIDSGQWSTKADLATAFLDWGQYAYGAAEAGAPSRASFANRLSRIEAVLHNQDNREHDLLDSDDYYQFEGGLAATAETLAGHAPAAFHMDHSRPERPIARTLAEEISRVMRSRVVNPKWIAGVQRHGYKGAFEIVATVDYMFAFAATTGAVKTHHFDLAFAAFIEDEAVAAFLKSANRQGFAELLDRFREAERRGFWTPRANSAYALLHPQPDEPND